jgi:cellulose synthase (UDP-forming)
MRGKWRIEVLRLQTVYGFAHAFNIVHMLQGRLVGWVPTNNKVAPPLAISVRRFYTWYLGTGQLILLAGLSYRLATRGIDQMWGMTAFAVLNLYILAPLIWDGARVLIARRTSTPVDLIAQSTSVNA